MNHGIMCPFGVEFRKLHAIFGVNSFEYCGIVSWSSRIYRTMIHLHAGNRGLSDSAGSMVRLRKFDSTERRLSP